ncbi:MAG: metallothionein [Pseudanabaenaceae cyanobacterium]
MAMVAGKTVQCACVNCICVVPIDKAIVVDGKYYCCTACAEGHKDGSKGCGCTQGCNCG